MIEERTYFKEDLHHGICEYCGEESDEITENGCCVDCVEEQRFIEMTMKMEPKWY